MEVPHHHQYIKKKLGLRWADSPRNFVLKEEDILTQAEKTSEHRVPPLHRGPLPCEWAGPLPVLWETRDRREDFFNGYRKFCPRQALNSGRQVEASSLTA